MRGSGSKASPAGKQPRVVTPRTPRKARFQGPESESDDDDETPSSSQPKSNRARKGKDKAKGKGKGKEKHTDADSDKSDASAEASDASAEHPKKRRKTAEEKAEDEEKKKKAKDEQAAQALLAAKRKAMKSNPPGVRIIKENVHGALECLCFYLNFSGNNALRTFVFEVPAVKAIFDRWSTCRLRNFLVPPNKTAKGDGFCKIQKKQLFDFILQPAQMNLIQSIDLSGPIDQLNTNRWPPVTDRAYVSWLATIYQLFQVGPEHFKDLQEGVTWDQPSLAGRTPEDWHRGYQLLLWHQKYVSASGRLKETGNASKKQDGTPKDPGFLTDDDYKYINTAEDNMLTRVDIGDPGDFNESDFDEPKEDFAQIDEAVEEAKHEGLVKALARQGKGKTDLSQVDDDTARAKLEPNVQRTLCKEFAKKAIRLWPPPDVQLPYDEAGGEDQPAHEHLVDTAHREDIESVLQPENPDQLRAAQLGLSSTEEQQRRETFWAMQQTLNHVSSQPLSYLQSCQYLGLNPDNPELATDPDPTQTNASTSRQGRGAVHLYPWQPIGIAWLGQMESSPLGGGLLAYDMGLGKTVVALAHILLAPPSPGDIAVSDAPGGDASGVADNAATLTRVDIAPSASGQASGNAEVAPTRPAKTSVTQLAERKHKPTLILCPSQAIGVWVEEISRRFPNLDAYFWYGSPQTVPTMQRRRTLGPMPRDLIRRIRRFEDHPETEKVVILSSYTTFRDRSVYISNPETFENFKTLAKRQTDRGTKRGRDNKEKQKETEGGGSGGDDDDEGSIRGSAPEEEPADSEDDAEEDQRVAEQLRMTKALRDESDANVLSAFESRFPGVFKRVVCDEAHTLKSTNSLNHFAVQLLRAPHYNFLTGTPMINRPIDLLGLISLLWKEDFDESKRQLIMEDFDDVNRALGESKTMLTPVNIGPYLRYLNPAFFESTAKGRTGEQLDPDTARRYIPLILSILQLRKTFSDEITLHTGAVMRIGQSIKPYRITTIELQMNRAQAHAYYPLHHAMAQSIGAGVDEDTNTGRVRMDLHRRLIHATLNPMLDKLARKSSAKQVTAWYDHVKDNGVSHFIKTTRPAPWLPIYRSRIDIARYFTALSAKLQWLAGYASEIVHERKRKLLVFTAWPLDLYLTECLLMIIGFRVLTVRSGHKPADRNDAQVRFNSPDDPSEIMVTSINVSAASINLQKGCSDVVFLDVPPSCAILLQAICRVFRLGQDRQVQAVVVTLDGTYDQVIQARAANKYIPQIAGMSGERGIQVTEEEVRAWLKENRSRTPDDEDAEEEMARQEIVRQKCAALYVQLNGQRSSRHLWIDAHDISAKNLLPEEAAFRQTIKHTTVATEPEFFRKPNAISLLEQHHPYAIPKQYRDKASRRVQSVLQWSYMMANKTKVQDLVPEDSEESDEDRTEGGKDKGGEVSGVGTAPPEDSEESNKDGTEGGKDKDGEVSGAGPTPPGEPSGSRLPGPVTSAIDPNDPRLLDSKGKPLRGRARSARIKKLQAQAEQEQAK